MSNDTKTTEPKSTAQRAKELGQVRLELAIQETEAALAELREVKRAGDFPSARCKRLIRTRRSLVRATQAVKDMAEDAESVKKDPGFYTT